MDNEGITNRTRELADDIEDQFDSWGNMKRVRGVSSLARTGDDTNKALRALESEIDSVLATL
jgi:superfamily II DNA/RNA helicase